ncbi:hypothetical protein K491DRAFT_685693 [Lophiostoma macrostomum CBS 122681]|uniref:Uncharacterized protein n=1 Tax=Lophiostoma macrostomum CBS 122681 TaxID=1314788 RepID=A0A6A6SH92_9PLEO|nr:hypothetical protein K491DRAFT_685693 [Lophiostoma macrostomum CBS 122681]
MQQARPNVASQLPKPCPQSARDRFVREPSCTPHLLSLPPSACALSVYDAQPHIATPYWPHGMPQVEQSCYALPAMLAPQPNVPAPASRSYDSFMAPKIPHQGWLPSHTAALFRGTWLHALKLVIAPVTPLSARALWEDGMRL